MGSRERREFNLCWLRVKCEDHARGRGDQSAFRRLGAEPALTLVFAGESWRFGDALLTGERVAVARKFAVQSRRVGRAWQSLSEHFDSNPMSDRGLHGGH